MSYYFWDIIAGTDSTCYRHADIKYNSLEAAKDRDWLNAGRQPDNG